MGGGGGQVKGWGLTPTAVNVFFWFFLNKRKPVDDIRYAGFVVCHSILWNMLTTCSYVTGSVCDLLYSNMPAKLRKTKHLTWRWLIQVETCLTSISLIDIQQFFSNLFSTTLVGKAIRNLFPTKYLIKYSSPNNRVTKSRSIRGWTYSTHGNKDKYVITFHCEGMKRFLVKYRGRGKQNISGTKTCVCGSAQDKWRALARRQGTSGCYKGNEYLLIE